MEEACVCVGAFGECYGVEVPGLAWGYCRVDDSVADGYVEGLEAFWRAD